MSYTTGTTELITIDTNTAALLGRETTGTITGNSSLTLDVTGMATVQITVTTTVDGGSFVFENYLDSIPTTQAISGLDKSLTSGALFSTVVANQGTNHTYGPYVFAVGGANTFQVRAISLTGVGTVIMRTSPAATVIDGLLQTPIGASTSALQTTGNASLASIDSKLNTLGQKVMASSVPVVIASNQSAIPVSGTVTTSPDVNVHDGTGVSISSTGSSLDVNITNTVPVSQSGTWTVQQGTPPWSVSQSGTWTTGRTWTLSSGTDSVAAVQSGTWNIGTVSTITNVVHVDDNGGSLTIDGTVAATQSGTWVLGANSGVDIGDVTINNASGGAAVNIQDGGNTITVDGTVAATQSGTWVLGANSGVDIGDVTINNAAGASAVNIQDGGNSITVDGTVTANQGTSPWVISGTVTSGTSNDTNYGTVGANTIRAAAQIGNATGAASFGAGATGAQTLRTATNNYDGAGNALTSTSFNSKQSLDVRPNNGFSTASNTRPAITNVSSIVLASNVNRKYAYIFNQTGAIVFIKFGATAVINQGIRIPDNSIYEITHDNLWTGDVHAVKSTAASISIEVFEGTT